MDDEFAREVLRLAEGYSILHFDEDLKQLAQELGVAITPSGADAVNGFSNSKPTSTLTTSSPCRRSNSTESQTSQSTGLTADYLRTSKEHPALHHTSPNYDRRSSGTSLSIKDYDSILSNAKTDHRRLSLNFSPPITASPSTFSLPNPSSREGSPRRSVIRGLSRLSFRRSGSSGSLNDECPHCSSHRGFRPRRILHTLPCGHRYCTLALRNLVKSATNGEDDVPPTCCRNPIPGALVGMVMSEEEQDALMSRMAAWEDAASAMSSARATSTDVDGEYRTPQSAESRDSLSSALGSMEIQEAQQNLDRAMNLAGFRKLRENQEQQRDRLAAWDQNNRQILSDECIARKQDRIPMFKSQEAELSEKHIATTSHVEDKHVLDEADLRETHEAERRNTATALRHMEAYCRGETTTGEPHGRTITDQDMRELSKAQYARDNMDTRQTGAINVLRGEQSRRMSRRLQKQEEEILQLEARQQRELDSIQQDHDNALRVWVQEVSKMKAKLQEWWFIETEIWRKRLEKETGAYFEGTLPPVSWYGESDGDVVERRKVLNGTLFEEEQGESSAGGSPLLPAIKRESGISSAFAVRSSMVGRA